MRARRTLLTLTLALAMSLSLLAPCASAAGEPDYTITLSDEPVGYAVLSFFDEDQGDVRLVAWVVPDGTTISVPVPEGGLWDWEGWYYGEDPYADYDFKVSLVNELIPDNCIVCYENDLIYEDDWLLLDGTPYIITQSCLDFIIAEDEQTTVTMLPAGQALSKHGYLADSWAASSVDRAVASVIPEGMALAYYADLRKSASRSTFAAIAVGLYEAMSGKSAAEETKDAENAPFTDVVDDPYIQQAYALGFVNGDSETTFGPDKNLSREDAAVMLSRVYEKLGGTIPTVSAAPFADEDSMYGYAKSPVAFMAEKGILNGVGDNRFNPKGYIKTEEALITALRMLDTLKVEPVE